jgi:4-hydroxybenzoate polyprenyltransferase
MSGPGRLEELARYLELGNLGLNLPFALAFLLVAADGWPSPRTLVLVVVAFLGARTAGHSFNRWADREFDRKNPRTQSRAVAAGRYPAGFALALTVGGAAVLLVASALLNPLALALAPIALLLLLGYSYTKRLGAWTTPFLGLVEAITPAAAFVAVQARIPWPAFLAVGAVLLWGTAFETIHSLGDLDSDRALGLRSLPMALGPVRSRRLLLALHLGSVILLQGFGEALGLAWPYYLGLLALLVGAGEADLFLMRHPEATRRAFRRHFLLAGIFLAAVIGALVVAGRL